MCVCAERGALRERRSAAGVVEADRVRFHLCEKIKQARVHAPRRRAKVSTLQRPNGILCNRLTQPCSDTAKNKRETCLAFDSFT